MSWDSIVLVLWLVLPPIYFFLEFHYVRRNHRDRLDDLRDSQNLAEKVWAGAAAALVALYFNC